MVSNELKPELLLFYDAVDVTSSTCSRIILNFQPGGPGILARGLYLVGASWDSEKNQLVTSFCVLAQPDDLSSDLFPLHQLPV